MTNDIEKSSAQLAPVTPMSLIENAQKSNASIEQMQQLFDLHLRWEENEAKKDYNHAIAQLKKESISIIKDGEVGYKTKDGNFVGYKFATLSNMVDKVSPLMADHGLTHSWSTDQNDNIISVTCTVSHENGHTRSVTLSAPPDNSGKKNPIQAVKSTVSYLQRITFGSIMGLAAGDQDDDAQKATQPEVEYISESQLADIESLLSEIGLEAERFLAWEGAQTVEEIPASRYDRAIKKLEATRNKK